MPLSVMFVVLIAAILHASWNFLIKQKDNKHISMTAVVLGHTPFAFIVLLFSPLPKIESLLYIFIGALLHTGYQLFLLYSYRIGDLSQVYPIARGVAPLLVTIVSVVLLGTSFGAIDLAAITIISSGIMSLAIARKSDGLRNYKAAILATVTGGFIAAYSLIDGIGARLATTAFGFYACLSILNAVLFSLFIEVLMPGIVKTVIREHHFLSLKGGFASFLAYSLVIWSFTMAPIAIVTALRETSIIFALFLGVFVLKERLDLAKVFSSVVTLLGASLLRINR